MAKKKKTQNTVKKNLPLIKNVIILALIVLVIVIYTTQQGSQEVPQVQEEPQEEVVEEVVEEPIVEETVEQEIAEPATTLAEYTSNPQYMNTMVEVEVYLKHANYIVDSALGTDYGVYTEMVTDGETDLPVIGLSTAQKRMFPSRATSEDMYVVVGKLRNLSDGVRLDVENIE